jgi:hypothetical protein
MKTYQANTDATSFNIMDDEAVIIHTVTSAYFSMNQTGTYLWNLMLDRYCSSDELAQTISAVFEQDITTIKGDVNNFLEVLIDADLVLTQASNQSSETSLSTNLDTSSLDAYETPDLVKFGDLETLILSGE